MRVALSATVALFLVSSFSSAGIAQDAPVSWRTPPAPTAEDFPSLAVLLGIDGMAMIECSATEQGVPEACEVQWESPAGLEFGDRALEIVQRGRLNPAAVDNHAVRASFSVRVPFMTQRPVSAPQRAWTGPTPTPEAMAAARQIAQRASASSSKTPFMPEIEAPADRRAVIEGWFREEMPSPKQMETNLATVLARNLSVADLEAMAQGRPPSSPLPGEDQMGESMRDLFDPEAVNAKVRARYCARFGCEITPPSPAG